MSWVSSPPFRAYCRQALLGPADNEGMTDAESVAGEASLEDDSMGRRLLTSILAKLSLSRSTAAHLIFCLPQRVYVVEKDNKSALVRDSDNFLAAYNHDPADESDPSLLVAAAEELAAHEDATGMSDLVTYSLERKQHPDQLWERRVAACRRNINQPGDSITMDDVMRLVRDKEISNEMTHYAVVMDPESGKIIWRRRYDPQISGNQIFIPSATDADLDGSSPTYPTFQVIKRIRSEKYQPLQIKM